MHPGGISVLLDSEIGTERLFVGVEMVPHVKLRHLFLAGRDATEAFFSLHRFEVLQRPQYIRLQIGSVGGEKQQIYPRLPGTISNVPYAEPTWLTPGYHSPYYKEVCGAFPPSITHIECFVT